MTTLTPAGFHKPAYPPDPVAIRNAAWAALRAQAARLEAQRQERKEK